MMGEVNTQVGVTRPDLGHTDPAIRSISAIYILRDTVTLQVTAGPQADVTARKILNNMQEVSGQLSSHMRSRHQ